MTVTSGARGRIKKAAEAAVAAQKEEYAERIRRIQRIVSPALTNAELSAGLELEAPPDGRPGASDVGRFLSTKKRFARTRPDADVRATIDQILAGDVLLAVQRAVVPGARRRILVCEAHEALRLDRDWAVVNGAGGAAPLRDFELDDDAVWSMLGEDAPPPPAPASAPSASGREAATPLDPTTRSVLGLPTGAVALGAMRLSTAGRPAEEDAIAVIVSALEHGVRLIDTADTYCLDEADRGHNERLIRRALLAWGGRRDSVLVATKAGLRRPDGRWFPDGRPRRLRQAAEESCAALGEDALDLFALHAPDPRVPFEDSVGELARLKEDGLIRAVGLCNVTLEQLVLAQTVVTIDAVQNEANYFSKKPFTDGVLPYCHGQGIGYLAHRPLGGHGKRSKAASHKSLADVAQKHGASAPEVALAWLLAMSPLLVPLVGSTRRESLMSSLSAADLRLDEEDLRTLEGRKPWAAPARAEIHAAVPVQQPDVVLVMGAPASGKTSSVAPYVAKGYVRLNRDEVGGKLDDLVPLMRAHLDQGRSRFVLDNTYPDVRSRAAVIALARERSIPVRAVHIAIEQRDALVNACHRMIERHGALLDPEGMKRESKRDPNMFPPHAIYRYFQRFEAPTAAEGFTSITTVPFERRVDPAATGKAVLLDLDGTVRHTRGGPPFPLRPEDVHLMPRRKAVLTRYVDAGWRLLGITNQAGVALGQLTEEAARACCDRTAELLGLPIDIAFCPHPAGAVRCWCRKPMPGLGVAFLRTYGLDPDQCVMVGDRASDLTFAENLGVHFEWEEDFFRRGAGP